MKQTSANKCKQVQTLDTFEPWEIHHGHVPWFCHRYLNYNRTQSWSSNNTQMFDTMLARCKVIPWISPTRKLFSSFPHSFSPFLGVLNKVNPNVVVSTYHQNLMIILFLTTTTNNLQHSKTMWLLIRF